MRKAFFACTLLLAFSVAAFAGTCPTTTYDNYLAPGFTCTVGDQTYSSFAYTGTSNPPGFSIPAGSIGVTPLSGPPGLQWSAGWLASTNSGVLEQDSLFQFQVNANPNNPITDLTLSIAGAGFTGTGEVIVEETACLGAVLPACTGGQIVTLQVFDDSAGQQLVDSITFPGVDEVSVSKDVTVAAGTDGRASLSVVTDQFSEGQASVPEPGTLSMLGAGVLALAGFARRRFHV